VLGSIVLASLVIPALSEDTGDLTASLDALASGDLTRTATSSGATEGHDRVAAAVNGALARLRFVLGDARSAGRDAAATSQELSAHGAAVASAAQRTLEGASSAAQHGQAVAQSVGDAHVDGRQLREVVSRLAMAVQSQENREARLRDLTRDSVERLSSSVQSLGQLAESLRTGAEETESLAAASEEIRTFVTLVRKMARQSKLLALNAAMEAARAGEQGSGFAVVAGEVRRLARSSSEAADRTDALVNDVLQRVGRMRDTSEVAVRSVLGVRDAAGEGLSALQTLDEGIARIPGAERDSDVLSAPAISESLVLRLQQLAREADALVAVLRDGASSAHAQHSRAQELSGLAIGLARQIAKSAAASDAWRLAPEEAGESSAATRPPESAPASAGPMSPSPAFSAAKLSTA
jgi:methyl-accepting chemotaxis protein